MAQLTVSQRSTSHSKNPVILEEILQSLFLRKFPPELKFPICPAAVSRQPNLQEGGCLRQAVALAQLPRELQGAQHTAWRKKGCTWEGEGVLSRHKPSPDNLTLKMQMEIREKYRNLPMNGATH